MDTPDNSGVEAGHSGDTPDAQTPTQVGAVTAVREAEVRVEVSVAFPEHTEEPDDTSVDVMNVVTRAGAWLDSLAVETAIMRDSDVVPPISLDDVDDIYLSPKKMAIQTRQPLKYQQCHDVVSENSVDVCGSVDFGSPKWLNESDVLKLKKDIQEDETLKTVESWVRES